MKPKPEGCNTWFGSCYDTAREHQTVCYVQYGMLIRIPVVRVPVRTYGRYYHLSIPLNSPPSALSKGILYLQYGSTWIYVRTLAKSRTYRYSMVRYGTYTQHVYIDSVAICRSRCLRAAQSSPMNPTRLFQ